MKVSVCMVTYNHETFIAQAIESVLMQQTDFDFELIIGEDCSTDGTRQIVEEYQHRNPRRIRTLLRDKNLGASRNFEEVLSNSRGEYIALLEGDDYWTDPRKLQEQVRLMDANPHFSMCGTATRMVIPRSDGSESEADLVQPTVLKPYYDLTDFLEGYPMHTSSIILRRGLVTLPAWISEVTNADLCIFALHAEKGPVGYLNEIMSCYRIHEAGIWTGKSLLTRAKAYQRTFDLLNSHFGGRFQPLLHLLEYRIGTGYWLTLVYKGMPGEARELYRQTFPRLVRSMPIRVLLWAGVAHCPDRCLAAAIRLSRVFLIRTRLRRMVQR